MEEAGYFTNWLMEKRTKAKTRSELQFESKEEQSRPVLWCSRGGRSLRCIEMREIMAYTFQPGPV